MPEQLAYGVDRDRKEEMAPTERRREMMTRSSGRERRRIRPAWSLLTPDGELATIKVAMMVRIGN